MQLGYRGRQCSGVPVTSLLLPLLLLQCTNVFSSHSSEEANVAKHWFGYCPDNNGWREAPFMCWRESFHRRNFEGALEYCYNDDLANGPNNNLMPVGKLRRFKVMLENEKAEEKVFWNEDGPFRVNAFKNDRCEWVEFPSGKKVPFHHFPDFNQNSGKPGDTLVWLPKSNRLIVESNDKILNVLCYRPKLGLCGKQCADSEWHDNECSDAGDCWRGKCICDENFYGFKCHLKPPPELNALIVGGQDNNGPLQTVEIYDIANRGSCAAQNTYPEQIFGAVGAWVDRKCHDEGDSSSSDGSSGEGFHKIENESTRQKRRERRAVICGGVTVNSEVINSCYSLDEHRQQWVIEPFMKEERAYAAGAVVEPRGDWWVVGGTDRDNSYLASSELLDILTPGDSEEDVAGHWHKGPHLREPTWKPCLVQISDCETALIGGYRGTNDSNKITIYNWREEKWRDGPNLRFSREAAACARIRQPFSNNQLVLVTGGFNAVTGKYLNTMEAWDPVLNVVYDVGNLPKAMDDHVLLELSEHQLLLVGGDGGSPETLIYEFDFDRGWVLKGSLLTPRQGHVGLLVPKHYARCGTRKAKRMWDSSSSSSSSESGSHSHKQ